MELNTTSVIFGGKAAICSLNEIPCCMRVGSIVADATWVVLARFPCPEGHGYIHKAADAAKS
jgi:hypothetical protein